MSICLVGNSTFFSLYTRQFVIGGHLLHYTHWELCLTGLTSCTGRKLAHLGNRCHSQRSICRKRVYVYVCVYLPLSGCVLCSGAVGICHSDSRSDVTMAISVHITIAARVPVQCDCDTVLPRVCECQNLTGCSSVFSFFKEKIYWSKSEVDLS